MLAWIEQTVGGSARVTAWRRLTGGLTSVVQRLTVERDGRRATYVLRRWLADGAHDPALDRAVAAEVAILAALERTGIPAPRVVASSTSAEDGGPAVLMTTLPGRVSLMPRDRNRWLRQMAGMLARIHSLDISAPPFESWLDASQLAPPPDAARPQLWRDAAGVVMQEKASAEHRFIHRDYQHFNLLWSGERLTGVVDWAGASLGPPDVDVGHCRLNLAVLFSVDVAERFCAMYEAESGRRVDPRWDLHALLSYDGNWQYFLPLQIRGRAPLDVGGMTPRMEAVLASALRRL